MALVEAVKVEPLTVLEMFRKLVLSGVEREVLVVRERRCSFMSLLPMMVWSMLYMTVYTCTRKVNFLYIGKIIKIWENPDKSRKIKIHWFFRPSEILYHLKDVKVAENEVFLASGEGTGLANLNPLVGKDLSEGEARVLMSYGWIPNTGLGTMLNYCDRVYHDRFMEKNSSEWKSKIGKLLMAGINGGSIVEKHVEHNVAQNCPEIKLELE